MGVATTFAFLLAAASPDAHRKYLGALRRELGLSHATGGNHSAATPGRLMATTAVPQRSLLLVIPPKHVHTVSEALGAVGYINKCSGSLPRTLPRHFVLAVFVLHQRYVAPRSTLMRLWLESLPPLDATCMWSDAELELLDDPPAVRASRTCRERTRHEYSEMMTVILGEGGMEDDLTGVESSSLDWASEYAWAVGVVHRYAWYFADDFPVLVPLALRFHPSAATDVTEWGEENDPGAAVYVAEVADLATGDEVTAWMEASDSLTLLMHGGYVWDELPRATYPLAMSGGGGAPSGTMMGTAAVERRRDALLAEANWTRQMEFVVDAHALNPQMMAWLRLVFASAEELEHASRPGDFNTTGAGGGALAVVPRDVRRATELSAVNALRGMLERAISQREFSDEEDDALLAAHARAHAVATGAVAAGRSGARLLEPRTLIAVTYRRLVKRLLSRVLGMSAEHMRAWESEASGLPPPRQQASIDARGHQGQAPVTSSSTSYAPTSGMVSPGAKAGGHVLPDWGPGSDVRLRPAGGDARKKKKRKAKQKKVRR